jgi:glycosyltransferase involved in cell wall biosynthesis
VQIFHCHAGIGWEGHQAVQTARNCGVPVVIRTEHLPYLLTDRQQQAAYQTLIPVVDRFICVSAEAQASHRRAGVPAEKLNLVRNGVHLPPVQPDRKGVRQEFSLSPQTRIVFTAARFTEQKGHRYLLEAIPAILADEPNAYFLWAGDGPLEQDLRRQQQTLGIGADRLIFAGWREDVPRLLAASDLFVLPSLFEGLPLVALEALALGVPIVGTRVCGTSETLEDGVSGRLVAPGDSAALAQAIGEALTHPALTEDWRQAGQQRFQQSFNAERMAQETAALYEAALARYHHSQRDHNRPVPIHAQRPSLVERSGSAS